MNEVAMLDFKRAHFERDNPGVAFPESRPLSDTEITHLRQRLRRVYGVPDDVGPTASPERRDQALNRALLNKAAFLPGIDATQDDFDLERLLTSAGVPWSEHVIVNWHDLNDLDELRLSDLSRYLNDLWYPPGEDLMLIERQGRWVVFIMGSGDVSVLLAP